MLIHTQRLRLFTCEQEHLAAIVADLPSLGDLLKVSIPEKWPEHPQAYRHALELLKKEPMRAVGGWWLYLFVDPALKSLVGSGGFKDVPDEDGAVEIGCEIAPAFRRQGLATEALYALTAYAFTRPAVNAVDAYSLPLKCPQSELFRGLGMKKVGEATHVVAGKVWKWRITQDTYVRNALRARRQ
ncbi:MAG: GNAT family protein [Burkholderiales bacterium]|jgi:RimJ/RimL family protein N-acetyltransferase